MAQTDPIADLLTRIRNAVRARHANLRVAYSRMREAICRVLLAEGFLDSIEVEGEGVKRRLFIKLRYSESGEPVLRGLKRVSRPSLRAYSGADTMPRVSAGMGVHVVTTPLGVMTDREARRRRVGGEILLAVW